MRAAERRDREAVPIGLLPAEPAIVGAPRRERGRAGIGDVDFSGGADEPAPATGDGAIGELLDGVEERRGLDRRSQLSGRARAIATSPVRAISISPCGRTIRSNESIFSVVPVTSTVIERRETSTM